MNNPTRVVIVDDHSQVVETLAGYLEASPEIKVVDTCGNGCEAVARAEHGGIDVMLMDVRMPVLDGVAASKQILSRHQHIRIVMLTTFDDDEILLAALAAGVHGFLLKDMTPQAVIDAISLVHQGGLALSTGPAGRITEGYLSNQLPQTLDRPEDSALSEREMAVLRALCEASSNADIAKQLYISISTVKSYLSTIMIKLGATSRLHAVIRAFELGLVTPPRRS